VPRALSFEQHRLLPGDVILYRGTGLYGFVIRLKTWHDVGHVEVYIGDGMAVASRAGRGRGVQQYAVRLDQAVVAVLRPTQPIDLAAGLRWFEREARGMPYGWWDLGAFIGLTHDGHGMVCSPFATAFLRASGMPIFRREPINAIAPCDFLQTNLLIDVMSEDADAS
jgi:hypothetical protein